MPTYYVMDRDQGMAETVAAEMPSAAQIAACGWLTERELAVYAAEFGRTGFQGGLNWYRCTDSARQLAELEIFSGRTVDVPACFIAGRSFSSRSVRKKADSASSAPRFPVVSVRASLPPGLSTRRISARARGGSGQK